MNRNVRLIARLDIKGPNLIKGVHLEGLRVIGNPYEHARRYYEAGADELIYMDIVASLYGRNSLMELLKRTVCDVFIPMTVGGGIRSVEDVRNLLRSGADKVAINTAAITRPDLIREVVSTFGSQCLVVSIEAKRDKRGGWEAMTDNGREHTGLSAVEWAVRAAEMGAGEILLTSIDQEGTRRGFDIDLIKAVTSLVSIPVIASGGMGSPEDLVNLVRLAEPDAVAMADILHYKRNTIGEVRDVALKADLPVRRV